MRYATADGTAALEHPRRSELTAGDVIIVRGPLDAEELTALQTAAALPVIQIGQHTSVSCLDEDEMAAAGWVRASSHVGRLRLALRRLLGAYMDLAYASDIGPWDPDAEPAVEAARHALADRGVEDLVGWARYNGVSYHDFVYATADDEQIECRRERMAAGWRPVYSRRARAA